MAAYSSHEKNINKEVDILSFFKFHYWFKSYSDVNGGIASGLILQGEGTQRSQHCSVKQTLLPGAATIFTNCSLVGSTTGAFASII